MAEWPLVGRGAELTRVRKLAASGESRGVVLAAAAGVGKTRLARECLHSAQHAGMATVVATASQSAAGVPLGAMASILSAFGGVSAEGDDVGTYLRRVVLHLVAGARPRRLFVLIDDAHLLDPTSAALVQLLAQRDEVFLCLTLRTREPAPDAVTALWKDDLVERIDIGDLGRAALEQLVTAVLGGPVDGATSSALITRSQGNVLFLRELIEAGLAENTLRREHDLWRIVGEAAPSDRLVELVETRLTRLSAEQRRLLELLAVGEPLGSRELDTLSGLDVAYRLEDLGLITSRNDGQRLEIRLAHPVYGEVLRSGLSGLHSRRLARSLAEVIEGTGMHRRDDVLRVGTWRLAGGGGRPDLLLQAAVAARWQYDLSLALRLANAASNAGAGFEADLLAAQLLLFHGRREEADARLGSLMARSAGADRIRAALARVDIAYMSGRPREMRQLLAEAGPSDDPELRAHLLGRQFVVASLLEGPHAVLALPTLGAEDNAGDAAYPVRITRALSAARSGRIREGLAELAEVERLIELSAQVKWWRLPYSAVASELRALGGDLPGGIDFSLQQYEHGLAISSTEIQLFAAWELGARYLQAGLPRTAARFTQEAVAHSGELGYDIILHAALYQLALTQAVLGRPAEARRALDEAGQVGVSIADSQYSRGVIGEALAWTAHAQGDVQTAREVLLATGRACAECGDVTSAASALHGLVRIGHADPATALLDELAQTSDGPWETAFAQHARAAAAHDPAGLDTASHDLERLGAQLLAAESAGDASAEWARAGDRRRASASRRRAADLAALCESAQTPSLQGLGVREKLTRAEQETARYAAAGHSNRAIAERLSLSVRTVETRLQNVYYKLGIRRREDLGAALMGGPPQDS